MNEKLRKRPCKRLQEELLEKQSRRCFYCFRPFGSWVLYKNKELMLVPHFDHVIPHSFTQSNCEFNFVVACQLCNLFKGSEVFDSIELIREYLTKKWLMYNKQGILYDLVDVENKSYDAEDYLLDKAGLDGYGRPK